MRSDPFYGDWMRMQVAVKRIASPRLLHRVERIMEDLGEDIKKWVQRHVRRQDIDWEPLADMTVERKGSEKIYFDSYDYIGSITVVTEKTRDSVSVEVAPRGTHDTGIDMQTLADYLEYGTRYMPARPLWRPVFAEVENSKESQRLLKAVGSYFLEGIQ